MRLAFSLIAAGFVTLASPVWAQTQDPLAPVKEVMDVTVANWSDNEEEWKGIFEGDRLGRLFSSDLAELYKQAAQKAATMFDSKEPVDPFDYDVVTNSQDGCPLQDTKMAVVGEKDGVTDVAVTFRLWACEENEDTKNIVSEVHFDVVQQGGKEVIDDIHHVVDGEKDSVKAELKSIIAGEAVPNGGGETEE